MSGYAIANSTYQITKLILGHNESAIGWLKKQQKPSPNEKQTVIPTISARYARKQNSTLNN